MRALIHKSFPHKFPPFALPIYSVFQVLCLFFMFWNVFLHKRIENKIVRTIFYEPNIVSYFLNLSLKSDVSLFAGQRLPNIYPQLRLIFECKWKECVVRNIRLHFRRLCLQDTDSVLFTVILVTETQTVTWYLSPAHKGWWTKVNMKEKSEKIHIKFTGGDEHTAKRKKKN